MQIPGPTRPCCASRTRKRGIAFVNDCNGRHCYLDPYRGGKAAVAEAARNLSCVGALPVAVTDCLNFGNPEKGEIYWTFEQAVEGMAEACEVLETPVVSGNVSFYNESFGNADLPHADGRHAGRLRRRLAAPGLALQGRGRRGAAARAGRQRVHRRLRVPEARLRQGRGPRARRRPRAREGTAARRARGHPAQGSSRAPTTAPKADWLWRSPSAASPAAPRAAP